MTGLDPAIQADPLHLLCKAKRKPRIDGRVKPGHDVMGSGLTIRRFSLAALRAPRHAIVRWLLAGERARPWHEERRTAAAD